MVSEADIKALVPNLSETTIFALVNALARRDRLESLRLLDTLIRAGEYLPLALTFLGGLLRMALAALCGDDEWGRLWSRVVQHRFDASGTSTHASPAPQVGHAGGGRA